VLIGCVEALRASRAGSAGRRGASPDVRPLLALPALGSSRPRTVLPSGCAVGRPGWRPL